MNKPCEKCKWSVETKRGLSCSHKKTIATSPSGGMWRCVTERMAQYNTCSACGFTGKLFEPKRATKTKPKKDPTRKLLREAVKLLTVAQSAYSTPPKWAEWNEQLAKWMEKVEGGIK
jgi:hypothetical protein